MVQNNNLITFLNLQSCSLMNVGLSKLVEGIPQGSPLIHLNIGSNELTYQAVNELDSLFKKATSLKEIILS